MATKNKINDKSPYIWAMLRIGLGLILLWAFLDKLFGWGLSTCRDAVTGVVKSGCADAYVQGGSPTTGFLKFGTKGPLADFYQGLAGSTWVDLLFMAGLLGIGLGLILGIGIKLSAITGSILMLMMWSAALWPEHHPFMDDHLMYILVLAGVYYSNSNQVWGLRGWWLKRSIVKNMPILE